MKCDTKVLKGSAKTVRTCLRANASGDMICH